MSKTETEVQNDVLLIASKRGWRLFRNNVGVAKRNDGTPVRYGLANISKQMNQHLKSSDLIGIKPVVITPDMVGQTIGVFTAIECKKGDWKRSPSSKREEAQERFIELVKSLGGHAEFCNNAGELS